MSQSIAPDPSTAGFPPGSGIFDLDADAQREIIQARQRIVGTEAFRRFWNRVLTVAERDRLGGDMDAAFRRDSFPANHLFPLRAISPERAIIEIALRLGFMTAETQQWLLEELGESSDTTDSRPQPRWSRNSGRLEIDGKLARQVNMDRAPTITRVLDRFESEKWPECVRNPIESVDGQAIYNAVRSLNSGLTGMQFHANAGHICWEPDGDHA